MSKRVWQYPEVTSIAADDYLLLDNETDGSKSILASKVGAILINKVVTERKVYKASDETGVVNGYKEVSVEVPYTTITDLEGDIVTFDDGEDLPLASLKVGIEPIQSGSGDPSPTNIRPIIGWDEVNVTRTGKNLIDVSKLAQQVVTLQGDLRPGVPVNLQPGTYTISAQSGTLPFYITRPANNYSYTSINALPFTFSLDNEEEVIVRIAQSDISSWNFVNLQLEEGQTATTYEPFGATYTIDLDGTRYGGTLDVLSGLLTVDRVLANLGNCAWTYQSTDKVFYTLSINDYLFNSDISALCSQYGYIGTVGDGTASLRDDEYNGKCAFYYLSTGVSREFYIKDLAYDDASAFKTAMNGVQFVYELATPLTYQLTPTQVKSLLGSNNVWADTGKIEELEYFSKEA
jgi:hypothetical protein